MGRKFEVTGKAVVFTENRAEIVDAEVRREFNAQCDTCKFIFSKEFKKKYGEKYLLIGGARTVPTDNIYARNAYKPERVARAYEYASGKFFRMILSLMRLAQFNPIHNGNNILEFWLYRDNMAKPLPSDDKSLYERYGFTPSMIEWTEKNYHDDLWLDF